MLGESYNLSLRYGNEYMDENPIVGEPGSFRLTKSHDATLTSSMTTNKSSHSLSVSVATPVKEIEVPVPPPPPLKTEDLPAPVRKATKGGERSPSTPNAKEKKERKERRKSKVAGVGTTSTPTATTSRPGTPK